MTIVSMKGMEVEKIHELFEISKMSSIIKRRERAKLCTRSKLSRCDLFKSLSSVNSVIPMIPFIGVLRIEVSHFGFFEKFKTNLISCDILAKNSDLLLFANSAASLAAVFF